MSPWTHARSYAGVSPASLVHRARLRRLRRQLRGLDLPGRGLFSSPGQRLSYAAAVASAGDIERYGSPARPAWSPHLGFDHRTVRDHIRGCYVETGLWTIEAVEHSAFGANVFLLVRRADEARRPDDTPASP